MNMTLPNDSDLRRVLPQIQSITMLDKGGFKAVYLVTLDRSSEALKLIQIPASDGSADAKAGT